jgi:hypothetical protein
MRVRGVTMEWEGNVKKEKGGVASGCVCNCLVLLLIPV